MTKIKTKANTSSKSSTKVNKVKKNKGERAKKTYSPEQLRPHHAKPFRKRHYGLLAGSVVSAVVFVFIFTSTSLANHRAVKDAKKLISSTLNLGSENATTSSIRSSYGFGLEYDQNLLYASGLDSSTNSLYVGPELSTERSYSAVKLGQSISDPELAATSGSVGLEYFPKNPAGDSADLAKLEAQLIGSKNKNFTITKSSSPTISGKVFLKSEWLSKAGEGVAAQLDSRLTTYVGIINGAPLTIVVNYGLSESSSLSQALDAAVASLKFGESSSMPEARIDEAPESGLSLLDRLTMTGQTSAAAQPAAPSSSEKISTIYGPSVVKIYNIYCMDVTLGGQLFVQDACSGSTGSGFFVGNQGHIATNGHVAANNPLDIAIMYALQKLSAGDYSYFNALADAANLTDADLVSATTQQEQTKIIIEKLYTIPSSVVTSSNKVENILVGLGEKQPDIQSLLDMTEARNSYPEEETIKQAKVIDYDYRAIDGTSTGTFKASDVALIKVEGSGYPSTKIGNISSLTQGSGLSIMGYPGAASANQLVESTESKATLTSGKVSSIKSAAGSKSQLIETDATIGHGNSGGPAFNDAGDVVGIATYTIDGSGEGNGVFNYVRDVADFSALASKNSIDTAAPNQTQIGWEKGIEYFYQARYSKAIKEFAAVKVLYPQHPKADQLSALAKQKIDAGEEVKDFPVLLVGAAASVSVLLVAIAILLILRHRKKHKAYQQHIEQGTIPPASGPGAVVPASPPVQDTQPVAPMQQAPPVDPTPVPAPLPSAPPQADQQPQPPVPPQDYPPSP